VTRVLQARLLVSRDDLVPDKFLLNVSSGPHGEIVAVSVDRNPWYPDFAEPPYAYTVACWLDGATRLLRLDGVPQRVSQVQPLGHDAFLPAAPRASRDLEPNAMVVDAGGEVRERFAISDGVEHVQIDPDHNLWVGYFDEGVVGYLTLAPEGLVRFGPSREATFRFNTLARTRGIPELWDCYALNVASGRDVYTYYYGESVDEYFPVVHIRDGDIADVWRITTVRGAHGLAVDGTRALFSGVYQRPQRLNLVDLKTGVARAITATDDTGRLIAFEHAWGRGNILYLLDARGVWALTVPDQLTV
jgi:hypothetical protein